MKNTSTLYQLITIVLSPILIFLVIGAFVSVSVIEGSFLIKAFFLGFIAYMTYLNLMLFGESFEEFIIDGQDPQKPIRNSLMVLDKWFLDPKNTNEEVASLESKIAIYALTKRGISYSFYELDHGSIVFNQAEGK